MKNSISLPSIFIGIIIALASCAGNSNETNVNPQDTVLTDSKRIDSLDCSKKELIKFKFSVAEANLPSPFEVVNDIYSYKVNFKPEILNPYSNIDKYQTAYKKAVNYGVYGIDLAYTNFYGQNQALLNYYIATKKLAEGLNIEETFNEFANSFNKNSSNKDSIVQIVDKAYNETDAYLKKNERYLAASHVLAGVLIEVNFISLSLLQDMKQDTSNEKLFEKIFVEKKTM